jgi:mannose/cellobiose epimerase-like protein (N-acyl-D-glucosamine 2-epimerase family)
MLSKTRSARVFLAWFAGVMLLSACVAPSTPALPHATAAPATNIDPALPTGKRWQQHLQNSLLPFWMNPDTFGNPVGNFQSVRCNDGRPLNRTDPCPEVKQNGWLMMPQNYVVGISRIVYGYAVAFHMTGDPQYLKLAKAGVDYLREKAFDRVNGGVYHVWNGDSKRWEPEADYRDPQQLSYALLGISMYYYLTRDPEVLPDILAVHDDIMKHYNAELNALQWTFKDTDVKATTRKLTAQLDQLNAHMALVYPLLPADRQAKWKADAQKIVKSMREVFYSKDDNLFFLVADKPEDVSIKTAETDLGHTIKSFWMMWVVGRQIGDDEYVRFAEEHGLKVLERAFLPDDGSWARGVKAGGALDKSKEWWIYNELDQFAMTMGMTNETARSYLPKTSAYYFDKFVDPKYGEVWTALNADGTQKTDMPKAWHWKAAYHTFEHALVGYITAQGTRKEPATLYYAFKDEPDKTTVQPYFYLANLDALEKVSEQDGFSIEMATFSNIR